MTVLTTSSLPLLMTALLLPLVSSVICLMIRRRLSWLTPIIATFLMFGSLIASILLFASGWSTIESTTDWNWFQLGTSFIKFSIVADTLSLPMMTMVILVSFLVHLYSVGFMADDGAVGRYFSILGFFTFAMLGLVVSGNLFQTFFFWELVGFSSYLLIGHWRNADQPPIAATKAFLFNRIGDTLFVIGLLMIWNASGTFEIDAILSAGNFNTDQLTIAGLLIFGGVMGKSAQFPLLTWLPDAMAGPTPVSALIHAATMVAAGVFLLLRIPFILTPTVSHVIGLVGGLTAAYAGWLAFHQFDLKKILAYSTISQLGLMMLAIGAGSINGAFTHLLAHAFFKACLFLAAGALIHSLYKLAHQTNFDPQDIRNMGGLSIHRPRLMITFIIASAALCGIPFSSGFISKEMIISPMIYRAMANGEILAWTYVVLFFIITFLTVMYSYRMVKLVFFGPSQLPRIDLTPTPPIMQWPVTILALLSLWIFFSWNPLGPGSWLTHFHLSERAIRIVGVEESYLHGIGIAIFNIIWISAALALVHFYLRRREPQFVHDRLDEGYNKFILEPVVGFSKIAGTVDQGVIDKILHGSVYGQVLIAKVAGWTDRFIVDGFVKFIGWLAGAIGNLTRSMVSGRLQAYIAWTAVALIIFIFWMLK